LDGGPLRIRISPEYQVTMIGPAVTVYEGETADEERMES
jgi:diaminopimelate epimerase